MFHNVSIFLVTSSPIENPKIAIAVVVENSPEAPIVARKVLDYYALKCVREWARFGLSNQARELFGRYPGIQSFRREYYRFQYELLFSRWFPQWVRFKCAVHFLSHCSTGSEHVRVQSDRGVGVR